MVIADTSASRPAVAPFGRSNVQPKPLVLIRGEPVAFQEATHTSNEGVQALNLDEIVEVAGLK